jgi:hypothetical protein
MYRTNVLNESLITYMHFSTNPQCQETTFHTIAVVFLCTMFLRSACTLSSFPPLFFHCFEDSNNNSCTRFSFRNTSNCNATIKSVVTLAEFDLVIVLPFRLALAACFCSVHQEVMSWGTLCQLVIGNWYRVQYFSHNTTRRHKLEKQHSGSVLAQRAKCSSWQTVVPDKNIVVPLTNSSP